MHKLYWINYVDFINWPYLYEHHTLQTVSCNSLSVQFTHFDFKSFTDSDKACDLTALKRIHINQNKNTHERAHTPCDVYTIKMLQFSTVFTRSLSLPVQWWKLQWNILWSMKPIINSIINCIPFIATVLASVSRYPALSLPVEFIVCMTALFQRAEFFNECLKKKVDTWQIVVWFTLRVKLFFYIFISLLSLFTIFRLHFFLLKFPVEKIKFFRVDKHCDKNQLVTYMDAFLEWYRFPFAKHVNINIAT